MEAVQKFTHDRTGAALRTVEIDGEPWFVAPDVASMLGYTNPRDAISKHVDEEDRATVAIRDTRQVRHVTALNESGLYALIFGSKLDSARAFKRWVTHEVLPTLRRTGVYVDQTSTRTDAQIEAEVQRQLQKRQYKEVVRDSLKAIGTEPGWQYGEIHNVILSAVTGMKAPALLAAGRDIQTWKGVAPVAADKRVATNFLFPDELELFNLITDAVGVDLRFRKPTSYAKFLRIVRDTAARYTD